MKTNLHVLSEDEKDGVHERTLKILADTGVCVRTAKGRAYLKEAGAEVDEGAEIVRFPRALVEESLRLAPKSFTLGARRPGWDLPMNEGQCTLMADGEGTSIIDHRTGELRPTTFKDWLEATRLTDALDEVGVYWAMAEGGTGEETLPDLVTYWRHMFGNFSKHVQDSSPKAAFSPWLLEILQAVFGDRETLRQTNPFSFLLCPQSPLIIDGPSADAYLAMNGYRIPIAVMPMPLMGGTGPGSMIGMTVLGNCEVLATLCMVQAAEPETPFIYAPALAVMNPRTGMYSAGAIENGLLSCAAIEMARYYGLPVEGTGGGTDTYAPGIQASYERALNALLPILSWPDLMVGSGLLGGSMVVSLEQQVIDAEVFRMALQAHRGVRTDEALWLDDVIDRAGPGGSFIGEKSTAANIRGGEWLILKLGAHGTRQAWEAAGKVDILEEAREKVDALLAAHEPLPLPEDVEKELLRIEQMASRV